MQVIKCTNCMKDLESTEHVCPYCGYDQTKDNQPPNALRCNTILHGRYLVGNVLGQGGFGITYVGFDLTLQMKVAVKEYFPTGIASRSIASGNQLQWNLTGTEDRKQQNDGIDRFLKEARRMAQLDSIPYIVRVRDTFSENGTAYIVMDFVEGVTLKNYLLANGPMDWETCKNLLMPIIDSLAIIHDHNFIHRDISPDNIMLQPDGTVRLLDMGAAMDVEANCGLATMVVVKKNFSPPEQEMESAKLGTYTDVYAMAATIYYCLTGKALPQAMERTYSVHPDSVYFPPERNIPADVANVLTWALALDAGKRIQDMRELKKWLLTETGTDSQSNVSDSDLPSESALQSDSNGQYTNQDTGLFKENSDKKDSKSGVAAVSDANELGMKWYKFIIYIQMFLYALSNL